MRPDTDRITVPTNGHVVRPEADPAPPHVPEPAPPAAGVAFTPTQLAVGFGILASIVLVVVRQARKGSRGRRRGRLGRG